MAGSKPRSESLKERSAGNNRRCVAVSDEYNINDADVIKKVSESEDMTFRFGSVVRSEKKSVFEAMSDVSSGIAEGTGTVCGSIKDAIKKVAFGRSAKKIRAERIKARKEAEEKERIEFLSGKQEEKEIVGTTVKAKYSVEAAEEAVKPKAFGEVVRKREPEKKENIQAVKSEPVRVRKGARAKSTGFDIKGLISALTSDKKIIGVGAMCLVVLIGIVFVTASFTFAYEGTIAGESVTIKSPEQFEAIVSDVNETLSVNFGDAVTLFDSKDFELEKKIVKKGKFTSEEDVKNILLASNNELYEMHVIYAGEKAILGVKDEEAAKKVLADFKSYYTGDNEDVEFVTDKELKYVCEKAPASIMMSDIKAAVMKLNGGEKQENMYVVEDGDNPWLIAQKFDTNVDAILAMNNMTEDDTIDIGDEILVEAFVPVVNVTTTQVVKRMESIPYETEIVKDKTQYNTWSEITVKGKNGEAEIEEKVIKVNGNVTAREVLSENIISEPVTQVKTVGTKEPPRGVGSRSFISPARGYVSSRYGSRSGGFHTGLDIAGSYGSPVVAADHGKVTFVGWSGGYGKLVKIDHQNGYVTYYAHNSSFAVSVGQIVSKGQTIAYMGSTGNSTGNHCHFEIFKNGQRLNPENYI